ncbi:MAG: hypothetical protein RL494_1716 [Bacteroidota bacterium]|jgi:uncharacterized membrane protein YhhN
MNSFLKYFLVVSFFYLSLILVGQENVAWYFKPLLLPFLIIATYESKPFESKKWLLLGLFFSWIGDIILMFADKGELYFIFGLVSFLVAHLQFIVLFIKQKPETNYKKNSFFWIGFLATLAYLASLLLLLFPTLGDLKIPVFVYAATISLMLIEAIKGYFSWQKPTNAVILIGAIFFVTSDSILAINKFYSPLPSASFLIMFTYIVAQYLITSGILTLGSNKQNNI